MPLAKVALTVAPPSVAVPVTLANDAVVGLICTMYCAPEASARLATVIDEPGVPSPGAKMPLALIWVAPTAPVPVNAAFAFTVVSDEEAIEPSTSNAPALTVVG